MKICIWCRENEAKVTFTNEAHIFPQSLGGKRTCSSVCDKCNLFFGSKQNRLPSVELALKEPLNISRLFLLSQLKKSDKIPRYKSEYFDYNIKKQTIKPKFKYTLESKFQTDFTKQFKRGVYKIFLEERSESVGDALDNRFDFIREYARYGIGDYPVNYCKPSIPAIFVSTPDLDNPVIRFTNLSEEEMKQYGHYSYFFMTHTLAIPVIRMHELTFYNYEKYMLHNENKMYVELKPINFISDLDFIFSYALAD
ncbi:HNH endonuclease [Longitalea arenae]|uniref:HNH endonuclease n=1 Tax=Longitalea arenae TaxID=2812558 RepID=UPI00196882E7|nr:HNH endonuclease [Longitalea arenae]